MYGIKAVDDIQISDAFEPEVSYGLGATLDLTSFVASSETYPDLAYAYTVEFGGESSEMAGSITFEETGVYTLVATVTTPGYTGSVRVEILVSEEVAPTADYLMQVADDILAADDKTAEEVIAQAEYLASWESVLSNLEGYENMDMFRYYAAMNLTNDAALKAEDNKLMYFDTALGKDQIRALRQFFSSSATAAATARFCISSSETGTTLPTLYPWSRSMARQIFSTSPLRSSFFRASTGVAHPFFSLYQASCFSSGWLLTQAKIKWIWASLSLLIRTSLS